MEPNYEIIAKLKELNEKLAQLIISTKETYQLLDEAIKKSKKVKPKERSQTNLLAQSANQWLN